MNTLSREITSFEKSKVEVRSERNFTWYGKAAGKHSSAIMRMQW